MDFIMMLLKISSLFEYSSLKILWYTIASCFFFSTLDWTEVFRNTDILLPEIKVENVGEGQVEQLVQRLFNEHDPNASDEHE